VSKLTILRLTSWFFLLTFAFSIKANEPILLEDQQTEQEISSSLAVYMQSNRSLSFDEFKSSRTNLPYQSYHIPNFGFNPEGAWLFGTIQNKSSNTEWVMSVAFSQLDQVDLYLLKNNELVYQKSGGRSQSKHYYRTPTFKLALQSEGKYDVYMFVKSERIPLVVPIHLQAEQAFHGSVLLDYLIWGAFYGALFLVGLYCIAVLVDKKELSALVLFGLVGLVFLWQMVWSGHSQLLPPELHAIKIFHNLDLLLPLICIFANLFTLLFLPRSPFSQTKYHLVRFLFIPLIFTFFGVLFSWFSDVIQALAIRGMGFATLFVNIALSFQMMNEKFRPAKTVLIGWLCLALGSVFSSLFIAGKLPVNLVTTYTFQISLIALTLCFVLALIIKIRFKLEVEVKQASSDAENNFLLIEEQNVHLDLARREAIKASEVKSQFLANMSHEIRTPLNAIIGFSQELQDKSNEAERDEHVRIINSAASDLLTIVNDILDFSKMEAGKLNLIQKAFSPRDALEDIASLMAKSSHLKQLEFIFDIGPLPAVLIGDSFKIKQLLSNLLSNALKFTNFGEIALRARFFKFGNDECMLSLEVEDSGIGISEEDKKKLFKPFNQIDDDLNRSFQGTGLGLVICQELAFLMKGSIEVESVYSEGSRFTINLPFKLLNNQLTPSNQSRFEGKRAGVYDPNPVTRKITTRLLKSIGFDTYTYDSLKVFEKTTIPYDYVFCTLPLYRVSERTSVINRVRKIATRKTVFLYSGPPPERHQLGRSVNQPVVLRAPLTLKSMNDLDSAPIELQDKSSKSQLRHLPAARVLATDDMELNLKLLDTWLKDSPVTLETATSGAQAVEMCTKNEYDLIFMDIQMPNMDGLEATQHIRRTALNLGTPIVAITAHAFPEEKERFLASGMDDYLPKPVNLEGLIDTIKNWCQGCDIAEPLANAINWPLAVRKANGNEEGAHEFLQGFVAMLPNAIDEIETHWQHQDFNKLEACIHKLHGASAYTGASTFQKLCFDTESNLKRNQTQHIKKLISSILLEADAIIEQWRTMQQTPTNIIRS
jgi:two-component system sensor histidine kinase BarA